MLHAGYNLACSMVRRGKARQGKGANGTTFDNTSLLLPKGPETMYQKRRFTASRGGHAPSHLREALYEFIDTLDDDTSVAIENLTPVGGRQKPVRWLIGQLWNCNDQLPGHIAQDLEERSSAPITTVARAVRYLRSIAA